MGAHKQVLGGHESVRVCVAQISPAWMNRDATADRAVAAIAEAAASGARLVVFPEVWLAGYPYWSEGWETPLADWAQGRIRFFDEAVMVPSETTWRLGEAARLAGINVVIGVNEIDPRPGVNTIYNTLLIFGSDGRLLGRHRKLLPTFSERLFWGAGDGSDLEVYDTEIGRIGALICGENLSTPLRAAMIGMGEDFHVAVFPGAFALHTGPALEEWDNEGSFWGHFVTRAHAIEAGCFVLSSSAYLDPADVPPEFPHKDKMNIGYSRGGSQIVSPLGVPLVGPVEGPQMLYADCQAWMIKAIKAIADTAGHYGRADVVRTQIRRGDQWQTAGLPYAGGKEPPLERARLQRNADAYGVDYQAVEQIAEDKALRIGN
jgi:predicted amidohydrolase